MASFLASNKPFITSILLDEVQLPLFDFATSIEDEREPHLGVSVIFRAASRKFCS